MDVSYKGTMHKLLICIVALVVIFIGGGYYLLNKNKAGNADQTSPAQTTPVSETDSQKTTAFQQRSFKNVKAPHYVSSEPANNVLLTAAVSSVSIKFNFDLAPNSRIKVSRDSVDVATGTTSVSSNKLSLSVPVKTDTTGNYQVAYTACWADGSCHDGSFGFSVRLPP